MKTYSIKLKSTTSQEHCIRRVESLTFPEAASWAFMTKIKMGKQWSIVSVTEDY
tara:strand:- start:1257 stop:1418 length:162 start_codon:yes stop_codon:yes gene_type:complete